MKIQEQIRQYIIDYYKSYNLSIENINCQGATAYAFAIYVDQANGEFFPILPFFEVDFIRWDQRMISISILTKNIEILVS